MKSRKKLLIALRQKKFSKQNIKSFIFTSLICLLFLFFGFTLKVLFVPVSTQFRQAQILIPEGASSTFIAKQLKRLGLIRSCNAFIIYSKIFRVDNKLHSGLFDLSPSYSLVRICRILEEKEASRSLLLVTIPEGFNINQIANLLAKKGIINKEKFLTFTKFKAKYEFLDKYNFLKQIPSHSVEGYLFPDTYQFRKNMSAPEPILDQFFAQFNRKIYHLWENSRQHRLSLHQTLCLASIVEKEAYLKSEQPIIAGVFYNRLTKNMPLGSCATVLYALNDQGKIFVSVQDTKVDSPYNTYLNSGLPPTPIANPGLAAFKAALWPKQTNYLYFVAKGNGAHQFTTNLKEHLSYQKVYVIRP